MVVGSFEKVEAERKCVEMEIHRGKTEDTFKCLRYKQFERCFELGSLLNKC